jgi:Leucine-rich repeat (LRR) protein
MSDTPQSTTISVVPEPSRLVRLQNQFDADPNLGLIQTNLPAGFSQASAQERDAYRTALRLSRNARADLKKLLKPLKGLSEFAEPLLRKALDARFGSGLDPRTDTLFHPTLNANGSTGFATQVTLLEAALHNFERKESVPGGFLKAAAIKNSADETHPKHVSPEQFADVCRHVNIGQKYQDHLQQVLEPDSPPGMAAGAARANARAVFITNELADMELYARAAFMRKHIGKDALDAVLALVSRQSGPQFAGLPMAFDALTLLGFEVPRVVIIRPKTTWTFTQVPLLLYVPQDPISPFKEFASLTELEDDLRARLLRPAYQRFFAQLIGERNRAAFFNALNRRLHPLTPMDGRWFSTGLRHRVADPKAHIEVGTVPIDTQLLARMYRQQIELIKDNARFLAVPTEDEDAKSRQARLQPWIALGVNALTIAASLVPGLGQLLMAYATVEMLGEVYHGVVDLSHGDFDQAFDHLDGVAANLAFMAALGALSSGAPVAEPAAIKTNDFIDQTTPVTLKNGQTRLWKPDLTPFATREVLPASLTPTAGGVLEHGGKQYVTVDEQPYEVQPGTRPGTWTVKHPDDAHPFAPTLSHNGVGAFRVEGELPQHWVQEKLFRRLGHSVSGLSETCAEQILDVTGVDQPLLRQVHADSAVPPGQLRDTIKRFQLDATLDEPLEPGAATRAERFEQSYAASEVSTDPALNLLRRDFPTLPTAVAEDLLTTMSMVEQQQMLTSGRMPLRISEAASWQQRQTRLNRAFEGFYLQSPRNPDTETLSLRLLDTLPGWSDQVRLEVRQGSTHGALLDSIGSANAPQLKTLVKSQGRYQAFDADANPLNGVPKAGNNLCASILHALPDEPRRALGFPHVAQGPELNAALGKLATGDRGQASRLLGIRSERLKFNTPKRLKGGRLGYLLSGGGKLPGFISEDHLLQRIGLLELDGVVAQDVLTGLRLEGLSNGDINARLDVLQDERQLLRVSLEQWAVASGELLNPSNTRLANRTRIGEAILHHWQATRLPGGSATAALRLDSVRLTDFPTQLPNFFYESVERVHLLNVVATAGEPGSWMMGGAWGVQVLEDFLRPFAHITELDISRSTSSGFSFTEFHDLPRIVSTRLPELRTLNLINQGLELNAHTLNVFGRMPDLQRLDLSGNHSLAPPAAGSVHLNLQRLGLDNMGMSHWPVWLNDLIPESIGEVSLAGNQIDQIPHHLLMSQAPSGRSTLIGLRGNRLSRSEMIETSLRNGTPGRTILIDPGLPPALQTRVSELVGEQAELQAALHDWADASSSRAPLSDAAIETRRALGTSLLNHWRASVAGRASLPVLIDSVPLAEFPQLLPETFYRNVNSLSLRRVIAEPAELDTFLLRFHELTSLEIDGHVTPMATAPRALSHLENLRELSLTHQGMLIDQNAMDYFSSLWNLRHLDLSGNRLGEITLSPVMGRHWESISLNDTGISVWPQWLDSFLPGGIDALSLMNNQLTELPAEIIRNRRNTSAHSEISLEGNPLSRQTMIDAHVSEYGNSRSFSFYMDLPEDISELPPERAWSSSESQNSETDSDSDVPFHRHGSTTNGATMTGIDPWLEGSPDEMAGYQRIWGQIEAANDAPMLMALVGRLQETADYLRAHDALVQRVWQVLGASAEDPQLRQLLNAMAEEAIASRTCGDGIRLEFNQMEVQVFARDSLRNVADAERGPTLYRLARRFYRLDEVDRLARLNSQGRDEAEVRLAYRLRLAESLDLPLPPARMLYRTAAAVTAEELQAVEGTVLGSQGGPGFLSNLLNRDFWNAWLREAYASEFAELKATFEAERGRVEDEFPELDDAYLQRIKILDADQKAREQTLMEQLTYREGLKYDD